MNFFFSIWRKTIPFQSRKNKNKTNSNYKKFIVKSGRAKNFIYIKIGNIANDYTNMNLNY